MKDVYSIQYAANIAKLLGVVLSLFGIKTSEDDLLVAVGGIIVLGGIVISIYDRYKKGDVTPAGFKKK